MCKIFEACCCSNDNNDQDSSSNHHHHRSCWWWLCFGWLCCCCCSDDDDQQQCCRKLLPCLNYSNIISLIRGFHLFFHTLLISISIFGLIWANVYFNDFDRVMVGSFYGGHLATLSAGGILYGLSGLYASIKHHRRLLFAHSLVACTAVLLRGFTWLLAMLHEYRLESFFYAVAPVEVLLAFLSNLLLRDACIYY